MNEHPEKVKYSVNAVFFCNAVSVAEAVASLPFLSQDQKCLVLFWLFDMLLS